ncbi:hypothetical protein P618_200997 [Holospora obtusa F1]|uniref:Uncharacterized protein n=1 Tax=Holospora obtusa F1 TaxID=1399147 RepID=W6TDL7_HOLOB|nr:hypothetical protein [Holospora obtusa]ETZ06836.1 hypothetical protein P618_200997 [Holospora obtusa F1]
MNDRAMVKGEVIHKRCEYWCRKGIRNSMLEYFYNRVMITKRDAKGIRAYPCAFGYEKG